MSKKVFKRKPVYIYWLVFRLFVVALTLWWWFWINSYTEKELVNIFGKQELIGGSGQRGAQVIQMFIVNNFGRPGMVVLASIFVLGALYYFIKELYEFKRFLRKDKLYNQGLVNNLEDDYEPKSIIQLLKNLFKPKPKILTKKYPSKKQILKTLKNNKYYK